MPTTYVLYKYFYCLLINHQQLINNLYLLKTLHQDFLSMVLTMNLFVNGRNITFGFVGLILVYLLFITNPIEAKTRISKFYKRLIRQAEKSSTVYSSLTEKYTELLSREPSCGKLCPKGIPFFIINRLYIFVIK